MAKHNNNKAKQDTSKKVHQKDKMKEEIRIRDLNWSDKQKEFIKLALSKEVKMMFISGPAGSSKSILSVYCSLHLIKDKKVSDIMYIRSPVESSDSKIGFLPGDADEKLKYYNLPFADKLDELLSKEHADSLNNQGRLQSHPLSFVRGMSWNAKSIILDECFPGHEVVATENGKKTILSLFKAYKAGRPLPKLQTLNEKTQQFEPKEIVKIWSNGLKEITQVNAGNRKIHCTPNHLFLTSLGWKKAEDLLKGDILIANNEDSHQVLKALNDDQKQIFLGSFLGDGSVSTHGENRSRLRVIHGIKQSDYCSWKAQMFGSEVSVVERNGYSQKPAVKFATKCFAFPEGSFISDKKKHCPQWILDNLDWRGIAIWCMDDGNMNKTKNRFILYTCSFDQDSHDRFVKKFKSLGIDCEAKEVFYKKRDKRFMTLTFNASNARKLSAEIAPYMHEQIEYKLAETNDGKAKYEWSNKFLDHNHIICDGVEKLGEKEEVFDIEVEDNHNFIIASKTRSSKSGPVVHNCQNCTEKEIITLMTRVGEFSKCFILADPDQSDLPSNKAGGFSKLQSIFSDKESQEKGIYSFQFTEEDIKRSELVKFIVTKLKGTK